MCYSVCKILSRACFTEHFWLPLTTEAAEKITRALISSKLDYGNSLLANISKHNIK